MRSKSVISAVFFILFSGGAPAYQAGEFFVRFGAAHVAPDDSSSCYSIRLLYLGVPKLMQVPEDLGMLYASALFAVALVYAVVVLGATVILWEYVAAPVFVDG